MLVTMQPESVHLLSENQNALPKVNPKFGEQVHFLHTRAHIAELGLPVDGVAIYEQIQTATKGILKDFPKLWGLSPDIKRVVGHPPTLQMLLHFPPMNNVATICIQPMLAGITAPGAGLALAQTWLSLEILKMVRELNTHNSI